MTDLIAEIKRDREAGTRGPWVGSVDGENLLVQSIDQDPVCFVGKYNGPDMKADTSRIARVPDLERIVLAAEELAEAALECHPYVEELRCGDRMRDALAAYRAAKEQSQ